MRLRLTPARHRAARPALTRLAALLLPLGLAACALQGAAPQGATAVEVAAAAGRPAMSPPGRPQGENRKAQPEGSPVSVPPGWKATDGARDEGLPAFPGAEGAGRFALGGRGGRVIFVSNLGDSGPGSLRAAVEAQGPRTVVFEVSGTIALKTPLVVRNGRITIAGQTAPGDGITLRDQPLEIAADDVVLRFIRSRLGDESGVDGDAIGIVSGRRIVIDHVSASWSTDEVLSASARFDRPERSFDAVSVQWCLISESLDANRVKAPHKHGFGTLLRAGRGARLSFQHNLWAHHADRMPRPGNWHGPALDAEGGFFEFRNNLFYDWGRERAGYNLDTATRSTYGFVANSYRRGPSSQGAWAFEESSPLAQAHAEGNQMDGQLPADARSLWRAHPKHLPQGLPAGYWLAAPLNLGPVHTVAAAEAEQRVLAHAGAVLVRDAVDQRVLQQFRQRGGRLIDSQAQVGGWPLLKSLPPPPDADRDGMPDAWERQRGLDPADAADGARTDPYTGYTELELYLASLVSKHMPVPSAGKASPPLPRATLHPALHLVGDSTMADKAPLPAHPERGWGMALRPMLDRPERLVNHAANGRSTRRFVDEGRWAHVLGQLAPGDVVLIQFAHNDMKADDPARYAEAHTDYQAYLRRFITELRARGATPLLATAVARRSFDAQGQVQQTLGDYPAVTRQVAAAMGVGLIDLNALTSAQLQQLGPEASKALFMHIAPGQWDSLPQGLQDNTHYVQAGAQATATLAVQAWRAQGLAGAGWLKP
ncbi:GDSL-type esterase/lipase family protein [Aquabacterium sp. OR-4]|uniref:GDSL-type esterase/lipase family protein n=1 Tax=Aquabacterium sp. OR-4 TaxID=2978127 RepID=UPI0028C7FE64|nr:GDSL-type esterase/lipase family protein [Aquabacterium sp. OR-4]MDT7837085.1 GDSL-type esterase/lipase family protein [Aquabacterium sp. OR-4]